MIAAGISLGLRGNLAAQCLARVCKSALWHTGLACRPWSLQHEAYLPASRSFAEGNQPRPSAQSPPLARCAASSADCAATEEGSFSDSKERLWNVKASLPRASSCASPFGFGVRLSRSLWGSINSRSLLDQFYLRLPVRRRFKKALMRGTLVWDKGQVRLPPIAVAGIPLSKKLLPPHHLQHQATTPQGRKTQPPNKKLALHRLRSQRIWFQD